MRWDRHYRDGNWCLKFSCADIRYIVPHFHNYLFSNKFCFSHLCDFMLLWISKFEKFFFIAWWRGSTYLYFLIAFVESIVQYAWCLWNFNSWLAIYFQLALGYRFNLVCFQCIKTIFLGASDVYFIFNWNSCSGVGTWGWVGWCQKNEARM